MTFRKVFEVFCHRDMGYFLNGLVSKVNGLCHKYLELTSCLLITLIKCLKGQKYQRFLRNVYFENVCD